MVARYPSLRYRERCKPGGGIKVVRAACLVALGVSIYSTTGVYALCEVALEEIASGFLSPTFVTHAGDGTGRLFVTEQRGTIRIVEPGGAVRPKPFLDLSPGGLDRVLHPGLTGENGLLGLVFHPDYGANGRFFVHYSVREGTRTGDGIVAEYRVSSDPNIADTTEKVILEVDQPSANHNGGMLAFNPIDDCSSCLYIALGDGGGYGDAYRNGQNKDTLLGTILRIDVDSADPYGIPPDNPFVGKEGADEIFCFGLRNPWRFSFDSLDGRLFIGDVGEYEREEIDLAELGDNLGWSRREGNRCFNASLGCGTADLTLPIAEYTHSDGNCSVIGGYVYRGTRYTSLQGEYLFGDYCSGRIWSIEKEPASETWSEPALRFDLGQLVSSFGEDEEGEILVVEFDAIDGKIHRIVGPTGLDLNLDGRLDGLDLFELSKQYAGQPASVGYRLADLSCDGTTGVEEVVGFVNASKRGD